MKEVDVQIRRAEGLEDYQAAVELQKQVWHTEAENFATVPILMIANRFGGAVLLAQEPPGRYVGFCMANLGSTNERKLFWWSHMTAVIEDYRSKGIGLQLKLRQRQEALAAGIQEIHWTFDPLQSINAYFNIHKLGVIVRGYEENLYGYSSSPLHRGLPTDRFVAEWHIESDRVTQRVGGVEHAVILRDLDRIVRINASLGEPNLGLDETPLLLEIPCDIGEVKKRDLGRAKLWQDGVRAASLHYFRAGYTITDFIMVDKPQPQALYVLEK